MTNIIVYLDIYHFIKYHSEVSLGKQKLKIMLNLLSPIKEIMSTELVTISEFAPLTKVEEIFREHRIHHIPVVDNQELIGIVSKSDFLFFQRGYNTDESKYDEARLKTNFVHQIMTKGLAKLDVNDHVNVALEVFKENLFHAIPIESDGKLKGIVTTYDIIKALADGNGAISKYKSVV